MHNKDSYMLGWGALMVMLTLLAISVGKANRKLDKLLERPACAHNILQAQPQTVYAWCTNYAFTIGTESNGICK